MKNASQIITSIQYKPQFKKILHYKCINKLLSTLLPIIQKRVKHGYIHNSMLYIIITASLDKYDKDNIIKTIKMVLNSPMILESEQFIECNEIKIQDVIVYVDHKSITPQHLHQTKTHTLTYHERASGEINIDIKDEKLRTLAQSIQDIIKEEHHDS